MSRNRREFDRVAKNIRKYADGVADGADEYVLRAVTEILSDVKQNGPGRGVPEDEGDLRKSGRYDRLAFAKYAIVFGGAAADYALVQHERTDYNHTIGEARYLVRGLERWTPGNARKQYKAYAQRMARRVGK